MLNPCLIPNGQVIIFNFPAGAGGKMLQNCVGLSRYCVLNKLDYARWQMDAIANQNFYTQKLSWIIQTLPAKNKMHEWLSYEFSEMAIYGINFLGFNKHVPIPNKEIYMLADKKLWSTVTVHNFGSIEHYSNYWPVIKHVCLINNENFGRKSLKLKNPNLSFDNDWATRGRTPTGLGFDFDIDSNIYDSNKFLKQIEQLYQYLEFDDFKPEYILEYYKQYMQLHA